MDKWAYERSVELDFSRPGKPTDNARVESFNGRLRQECVNAHWFLSMDDARAKIAAWRTFHARSDHPDTTNVMTSTERHRLNAPPMRPTRLSAIPAHAGRSPRPCRGDSIVVSMRSARRRVRRRGWLRSQRGSCAPAHTGTSAPESP
jgi:hypothetical protein